MSPALIISDLQKWGFLFAIVGNLFCNSVLFYYAINSYILKDTSYPYWISILQGTHMVLGFTTEAQLYANDLQYLAYYLTGTGGKAKLNIQNAFFTTYLDDDNGNKPNHLLNTCRILAQNSDVADNDTIEFFNTQIPIVGGTQIAITLSP